MSNERVWIVRITTDIGWLDVPVDGAYGSEKEAVEASEKALTLDFVKSAEVIEVGGDLA